MELLAPAGNMESLKAAVQSGADAVYFAGRNFGARSYADNFSLDEIQTALDYCHLRGVKGYITVNTTVLDRELQELETYLGELIQIGADAFIVQDLGVMRLIRELSDQAAVHASTQMTIHNLAGVRALEELGVKRVVVSRELSRENLKTILTSCGAELEVFVHGAMCMCYSGQCYMSSVLGGRSGNRGRCAQPCRLPYRADGNKKEKFYLSLKDLSLIRHLEELQELGAASLKIEGRMKGPAYVAAVVGAFRRCLDEGRQPTREELKTLDRVFYRGGLSDGYFSGQTGPAMFAFDKPDNPYQQGDDALRKELLSSLEAENRKRPLSVAVQIRTGFPIEMEFSDGNKRVSVIGETKIETASSRPTLRETVAAQLSKMGGTPFSLEEIEIQIVGQPYVPVRELNHLRRLGLKELERRILLREPAELRSQPVKRLFRELRPYQKELVRFRASALNLEQYFALRDFPFERIYLPMSLLINQADRLLEDAERIIILPPAILKDDFYDRYQENLEILKQKGFHNLCVQNFGESCRSGQFRLFGGFRLNVCNSLAAEELRKRGLQSVTLSPELNLAQIRGIQKTLETEVLAYGRLPLMLTENCITRNIGQCPCDGQGVLTDRKDIRFPLVRDDGQCRSVLLNAVPTYMGDKLEDLKGTGIDALTLSFTTETPEEVRSICEAYLLGRKLELKSFTRLHFYKGVM